MKRTIVIGISLHLGKCQEVLKSLASDSIDLVVTSPPYDSMRDYEGSLKWDTNVFCEVAEELVRVLKNGGVIVWVVGDKTSKASESGTSLCQALHFKIIGLNLHDTMIYSKRNVVPLTHNRYEQAFEYMFVFSKGTPKTFNPIEDKPNKDFGKKFHGTYRDVDGSTKRQSGHNSKVIGEFGRRTNIWTYSNQGRRGTEHPATFPLQLAIDHITSWSNVGDVILDPFMGSGTTGEAAIKLNRDFVGIEVVEKYHNMAQNRLTNLLL